VLALLAETDKHGLQQDAVLALLGAKRRQEIPPSMTPRAAVDALRRRLHAATTALTTGELDGAMTGPGLRLRHVQAPPVSTVDIGPCSAAVLASDDGSPPLVVLTPLEPRVVPAEAWAAGAVSFKVAPGEARDLIAAGACRIRVATPEGAYDLENTTAELPARKDT